MPSVIILSYPIYGRRLESPAMSGVDLGRRTKKKWGMSETLADSTSVVSEQAAKLTRDALVWDLVSLF